MSTFYLHKGIFDYVSVPNFKKSTYALFTSCPGHPSKGHDKINIYGYKLLFYIKKCPIKPKKKKLGHVIAI